MKSAISIPWQALNVSMFYTSFLNDSKYAIFVQLFLEEQADNSAQSYWVSIRAQEKIEANKKICHFKSGEI